MNDDRQRGPRSGGPPQNRPPRPGGGGPPRPMPEGIRRVAEGDLRSILDGNAKGIDDEARQIARGLGSQPPDGRLTTNAALRSIVGDLRRIELHWAASGARDLVLLKPKIAYQAGRAGGSARGLGDLAQILLPAIDMVDGDAARFRNLSAFVDAIVGYYFADARPQPAGR